MNTISTKTITSVSRRGFLTAAGGVMLGFVLPGRKASAQQVGIPPGNLFAPPPAHKPNAYIHIGTDESVTFYITKSEMGQGPATACSQMLAEELECDWSKVRMEFAPVDPASFGHQTTVGSQAVRTAWEPMRRAGAEAREMLIQAAADKWGVNKSQLRAENGFVINPANNERFSYGSLAEAAAKVAVPDNVQLKDPKNYKIIGKAVKRLDSRDKILGKPVFGLDTRMPGMLYATLERPPAFGGKIASFDAAKAKAIPGVKDVFQTPRGVAVVADNTWAAMQGKKVLSVQFDDGPNAAVSSATIRASFVQKASEQGAVARKEGDAVAGLAKAAKKIDAVYEVPFLSHAPMEPMNCTVHARPDGADVWAPTQSPTTTRAVVAEELGLPPEKVNVHVMFCGGGFGRRGEGELDWVLEAAQIAKRIQAPVKLTWTREDDMQHDYYRPASYVEFSGGIDAQGWPAVLKAKVACPSFSFLRDGVDGTAVSGLSNLNYELPDMLVDYRVAATPVPISYWRAPGANQNTYFAESFFDELCALGSKDPVEARRRLLAKTPRLLNVLNVAAEKSGWGTKLPAGRFRGVAVGSNSGSFCAMVAEVSIVKGKAKVHRVVSAFDCGLVINPGILKQQVEGGVVFGLAAAAKGEITLERGRVVQTNFNNYDVTRMDESPMMETHIIPSTERPSGAGEATNPTIIPAVVNAIFAATGKRVRKLPLRLANLA
ncbi:MAG: xanthine dehydrogenase family protein molybdopterin-binding subunit [Bryobacteraceae bacterium]